jgi:hypothetical protein
VKKRFFVALIFMVVSLGAIAQPGDPGGDPDAVPFTGLEYLIGGGVLIGIRSLLRSKKEKN